MEGVAWMVAVNFRNNSSFPFTTRFSSEAILTSRATFLAFATAAFFSDSIEKLMRWAITIAWVPPFLWLKVILMRFSSDEVRFHFCVSIHTPKGPLTSPTKRNGTSPILVKSCGSIGICLILTHAIYRRKRQNDANRKLKSAH